MKNELWHKHVETSGLLSCGCEHCKEMQKKVINAKKTEGNFSIFKYEFIKVFVSAVFIVVALMSRNDILSLIFNLFAFIVSGYDLVIDFIKNILKKNLFDENFLMLIASITAFILKEYFEGAFIIVLFKLGETLEGVATAGARRNIVSFADFTSVNVHLINLKGITDVEPESVEVGSIIEVRKGESVPIDGILIGKIAELDMRTITGESKYVIVNNCDTIYSGSINVGDPFVMRTSKLFKDSTVEEIISMIEGATEKKAKSQRFISSFAKVYTPIIVISAFLLSIIPPFFDNFNFIKWIYKSLSFLVVSCPCALVISVPLAFFVGIGSLSKKGILIKGSNYVELLSKLKTIVFDKTGTLTKGNFVVLDVKTQNNFDKNAVLDYVCALEKKSTHPISKAIVDFVKNNKYVAEDIKEITGQGLVGNVNGKLICVGNAKLMKENAISVSQDNYSGTVLYVAVDGKFAQKIYIADEIKENTAKNILKMKGCGVKRTYMLSGDKREIAEFVGDKVGIDEVYSELLPEEKMQKFQEIKNIASGKVAYVGDGVNDSLAIMVADVGVAMGGVGSDIAVENSDVIMMDDDLGKIPLAISFSKKIKRIVNINIVGSLMVKSLLMLFGLITSIPVWLVMFGDVGVMLVAVMLSLSLGVEKNK